MSIGEGEELCVQEKTSRQESRVIDNQERFVQGEHRFIEQVTYIF